MIEESHLGFNGEGYGLAAFTKGQITEPNIDMSKVQSGYLEMNEQRRFSQVPFSKIMGRGNVSQHGRRTDFGLSHSSFKLSDIKSMSNVTE